MPTSNDRSLKLIATFLLALTLFNFPLISLFSQEGLVLGLPALYWYIFLAWALVIGLTAWLTRDPNAKKPS
ncbi:MAG: hypothetical protein GVY26_12275 [Bacteroidetes bacterium]|jgi:hypothetical protein|nr:hypothetical protein [Bacteroidota bacterium]